MEMRPAVCSKPKASPQNQPWGDLGEAGARCWRLLAPDLPVQGGRAAALPVGSPRGLAWQVLHSPFSREGQRTRGAVWGCRGHAPGQAGCLAAPRLAGGSRAKAVLFLPRRRARAAHCRARSDAAPALCFWELSGFLRWGRDAAIERDLWGSCQAPALVAFGKPTGGQTSRVEAHGGRGRVTPSGSGRPAPAAPSPQAPAHSQVPRARPSPGNLQLRESQ